MAKQYISAPINPIWFYPVVDYNSDYNTIPFDAQQPQVPYVQKIQFGDPCKLQRLSDWEPTLKIFKRDHGTLVDTIIADTPVTSITGETFTVYEFTITWGSYPASFYYLEISYTDDSSVVHTERSGDIQTAVNHPGTLRFDYTNSENNFSAIFDTPITFTLRVEASIQDYEPGFEDVTYNDQDYNTTLLSAIPFRQFNLYVGSARGFAGIPPIWVDKLNWAFACNQLQIDGVYYQHQAGSKWTIKRADQTSPNFIGAVIGIIEVNNLFLQQYNQGDIPAGTIQVITRTLKYLSNSANITIPGIFTANSLLTRIIIYNLGGDIFTVNAGTAADGSVPIAEPLITEGAPRIKEVWNIDELFDSASTLYITGLAGTNCNIFVEYDQLDAPNIAPVVSNRTYPIGHLGMYEEVTVGDFATDWNIGTGAGNAGTPYEGCVISGTNGTKDRNGLVSVGWNPTLPLTRDILTGNSTNSVVLTRNNLPAEGLNIPDLTVNTSYRTGSNSQHAAANDPSAPKAKTENMGIALPVDISNAGRITVYFVCIS